MSPDGCHLLKGYQTTSRYKIQRHYTQLALKGHVEVKNSGPRYIRVKNDPLGSQPRMAQAWVEETKKFPAVWESTRLNTIGTKVMSSPGPSASWGQSPSLTRLTTNHVAKVEEFAGEDNTKLDDFINQVKEIASFYGWYGIETCHLARAHISKLAKPICFGLTIP